jgi:hypothetical protein
MNYELSVQIELFHLRDVPTPATTTLENALAQTHQWVQSLRSWILATNVPVKDSIHLLGLANRFEVAAKNFCPLQDRPRICDCVSIWAITFFECARLPDPRDGEEL